MADREDIMTPRKKKDGGTYWVKIGTCWVNDGKRQLVFDALPLPDSEGRCVANLFEPKPRDGVERKKPYEDERKTYGKQAARDDLDDEIPF